MAALLGPLVWCAASAFSEEVHGRVRDARSGVPLGGVLVSLGGPSHRASTSSDGGFSLRDVRGGTYRLRAVLTGYARAEIEVWADAAQLAVEIELHPLTVRIDEAITVTAQGDERRALDVPESVSALGPDELSRRVLRSTSEALVGLTGVFMQKTNHGGGSPFVRGVTGNQVLLMVDRIRLSNSTYRYGPNQYLATVAPLSIERIEVVRGSGSTLYGSDAIGGVVKS